MEGSRVSPVTILKAKDNLPGFLEAFDAARIDSAVDGGQVAREFARARALNVVSDAYKASQKAPEERDRVSNRRLILEVAQVVGQTDKGTVGGTNIQIVFVTKDSTIKEGGVPGTPPSKPDIGIE